MLVGTVCNDDACAKMLAQAGIIQSLIELLNGKKHNFSLSVCLKPSSVGKLCRTVFINQ